VGKLEKEFNDPSTLRGAAEASARKVFADRAAAAEARLKGLEAGGEKFLAEEKAKLDEKAQATFPATVAEAQAAWKKDVDSNKAKSAPVRAHAEPFPGKDEAARNVAKLNFLALVFCLMVGTASLPHILMRYYTTPSVREARISVGWSLFFIFLLYFTAPALAVLVKFEIYSNLVGSAFSQLPAWVSNWQAVDKALLFLQDVNLDGIVQRAEIALGGDIVVLATPEIAGLPYVIAGLVAAGGLAAALSTADGLLLTIANALSHDVYYKMLDPNATTGRRIAVAKSLLLVVALIAAYVTSLKPGDILFLVGAAFSIAASAFFPALVLGVFWKRANKAGAVIGMVAGLAVCMYYMYMTYPFFGVNAPKWFDINPISAGIFGIPIGFLGVIIGSLLTPAPSKEIQQLVDHVRYPNLAGDVDTRAA
jgi:cation/acetate symporter